MSGIGGEDDGRGPRGERRLVWPPAPGSKLEPLAAELMASIDAAAQGGAALALIELEATGAAAAMQLCEQLAAEWRSAGRACLVVDGHPTAPFFGELFAGSPEGFTEILHYGLSPAAAAQERPHCAGLWIPAGGRWALPLDSPDEPALTLSRLLGEAERVLLLADAGNAEGLLPALRHACHFQLRLETAPAAAAALPEPAANVAAEPAPALSSLRPPTQIRRRPEEPVVLRAQRGGLGARRQRGRRLWPLLLLPAGALLLLLGIYLITGPWGKGEQAAGSTVERGAGDAFSPLPAPAELPFAAQHRESSNTASASAEPEPVSAAPAREPRQAAPAGLGMLAATPTSTATLPAAPPAAAPGPIAAREGGLERRFEPAGAWSRLLTAPGPFYVHLESFRDSVIAAEAARAPAAQRVGVRLAPALVEGLRWYRLWLGPFADLAGAAACRDSLLDRAGEDYCRIVTPSP